MRSIHSSWRNVMMLGAIHYHEPRQFDAFQIVPDENHNTVDTPDMSKSWNPRQELVWQWLELEWRYSIPARSRTVTNLRALKGQRITEAARWEDDPWELFAGSGPETSEEDLRIVPLATLLALDRTLSDVTLLKVGEALWRNPDQEAWNVWECRQGGNR